MKPILLIKEPYAPMTPHDISHMATANRTVLDLAAVRHENAADAAHLAFLSGVESGDFSAYENALAEAQKRAGVARFFAEQYRLSLAALDTVDFPYCPQGIGFDYLPCCVCHADVPGLPTDLSKPHFCAVAGVEIADAKALVALFWKYGLLVTTDYTPGAPGPALKLGACDAHKPFLEALDAATAMTRLINGKVIADVLKSLENTSQKSVDKSE